jgi:hypothetical protein
MTFPVTHNLYNKNNEGCGEGKFSSVRRELNLNLSVAGHSPVSIRTQCIDSNVCVLQCETIIRNFLYRGISFITTQLDKVF